MLSIQDFGCGIPKDKLDKLFINFGNLTHNLEDNPVGRGLGLSICKNIVEQMGGEVIVTSEEGQGSTFSMTFKVMTLIDAPNRLSNKNMAESISSLCKQS